MHRSTSARCDARSIRGQGGETKPNGRDGARKQRFGLAVRCALLAQQFVHGLLIDWSSALHFAEEAVDEVRRPLSCR